ncbi:MAG TPA: hypothetical protein VJ839_07270 [Candidatus Limnocylindria bacterium]|nr:hypothetical protein [Candidatus Limnocylindria bacterium]
MSTDRDITRIVRSWMDEGVTQLPDRVLDAVLDQLPATPQRRPSWLARRFLSMNTYLKFGLAAAAVVAAVVIGLQVVGQPNIVGPPDASPTPARTPAPSSEAMPLPAPGALDPGVYLMPAAFGGVDFAFTVPAGWEIDREGFVRKNTDSDATLDITTGVMFSAWTVDHVFADACVGEGTEQPVEETVDALAAALASQVRPGRETRGPAPGLEFDGHPVEHVTLYAPGDLGECGGRLRTWPGLNGDLNSGWPAGPGQTDDVYIVDVDGTRLVLVGSYWAETATEDRQELDALALSAEIAPQ